MRSGGALENGKFKIRYGLRRYQIPERGRADLILDRMKLRRRFYEEDLLKAIKSMIGSKNGIALDCGANVGNHTLFFASVIGLDVIAFEPIPENITILEQLIELNQLSGKVKHIPTAVGREEGQISLGLSNPDNPGMYSAGETSNSINVSITTLDKYIDDNNVEVPQIKLLKIDVEGHEMAVIEGAQSLLAKGSPVIALELAGRAAFDAMYERLANFGYAARAIYCATPTVIFEKGVQEAAILEQICEMQSQYSDKQGLST